MTEEQARELWRIVPTSVGSYDFLQVLNKYGYIRKSELEILVEEAEKDYDTYVNNFIDIESDDRNELIEDMYKTIQALKKSHPEFTK